MCSPWYVLYAVSQLDLLQVVVVSVAKRRGVEMDLGAVTCLDSQGYRHLKGSGIGKIFERLGFGGGSGLLLVVVDVIMCDLVCLYVVVVSRKYR